MITAILFPFLKFFDLIKRIFIKKRQTKVTFKHPNKVHLMREIYTRKKENPQSSFFVEAHPDAGKWDEYIRMGKSSSWLHNYYHLNVTKVQWHGKPTWRTFTTAIISSFQLDFSAPDQTILTLNGDQKITDSPNFQSWFKYCRQSGVEDITVDKL